MKFATLFFIASTVLALPSAEQSDNVVELAKKEAAPASDFRFPTEEEDDPKSPKYRFKIPPPHPLKNKKDNNGKLCSTYFKKTIEEVPEECMKTVFCKSSPTSRYSCDDVSFNADNWSKQKLIDEKVLEDCAGDIICKPEDEYKADTN